MTLFHPGIQIILFSIVNYLEWIVVENFNLIECSGCRSFDGSDLEKLNRGA